MRVVQLEQINQLQLRVLVKRITETIIKNHIQDKQGKSIEETLGVYSLNIRYSEDTVSFVFRHGRYYIYKGHIHIYDFEDLYLEMNQGHSVKGLEFLNPLLENMVTKVHKYEQQMNLAYMHRR